VRSLLGEDRGPGARDRLLLLRGRRGRIFSRWERPPDRRFGGRCTIPSGMSSSRLYFGEGAGVSGGLGGGEAG